MPSRVYRTRTLLSGSVCTIIGNEVNTDLRILIGDEVLTIEDFRLIERELEETLARQSGSDDE